MNRHIVEHAASGDLLPRSSVRRYASAQKTLRSIATRGFTMIELCFVISIIAILAAILFPAFARAREAARRTSCASNLSQIGAALNLYAQSYDGRYPKRNNDFRPLWTEARNTDIWYCPSDSTEHAPAEKWQARRYSGEPPYSSYVYRGGLSNDDRADRPIAGEREAWHGDLVNMLYLGGYVKGVFADYYKPPAPIPLPPTAVPGAPGAPGTPPGEGSAPTAPPPPASGG
jgi:prepilin-type N-terminal cleavage/methylation domain-containing protein